MADFSALKTSIQNYIKQNGNEEITGNLLQQILLSMVTTLGDSAINDLVTALNTEIANRGNADTELGGRITSLQGVVNGIISNVGNGYVYAGIATPSSTPASGKVFYLALTAGTYTNFGATVVPQGINILKYNGSAWSLDSFLGLDDAPTQGSNNLVKSGGVLDSIIKDGSAFDLSAYNSGTTYADLSAALTALNALPAAYKKGGMSVKFVQTSDNKYVQYRLMSDSFNTTPANWQGVDEEPTYNSKNLTESGGIFGSINTKGNTWSLIGAGLSANNKFFLNKGNDINSPSGWWKIVDGQLVFYPSRTYDRKWVQFECTDYNLVSIKSIGCSAGINNCIVVYVDDTIQGFTVNDGNTATFTKDVKQITLNFFDADADDGFELYSKDTAVKTVSQILSDTQKKQVRANIGFGDGEFDGYPTENSMRLMNSDGLFKTKNTVDAPINAHELQYTTNESGGYYTYDGSYISSGLYIGCEVDVTPYIGKYLTIFNSAETENGVAVCLVVDSSDNIIARTGRFYKDKDYLAIRVPESAAKVKFTKANATTARCIIQDCLADYVFVDFAYNNTNGNYGLAAGWRTTDFIPVSNKCRISAILESASNVWAIACYGLDKKIITNLSVAGSSELSNYNFAIPDGVAYVKLCWHANAETIITFVGNNMIDKFNNVLNKKQYHQYGNVIRKPFDFKNKHAVFFGDSITHGYLPGGNRATNPYPKAFSIAVGLSSDFDYGNRGNNGATIVPNEIQGTNNLTRQISEYPLDYYGTPDFVFIAGGANDLACGTAWDVFEQGMKDFLDIVNNKFASTIPIIFITPINEIAPILTQTSYPVSDYPRLRNIMTRCIIEKDVYQRFSIIQGNKLPFPKQYEDTKMNAVLYSDNAHLTEIGYQLYAAYLQGVLC